MEDTIVLYFKRIKNPDQPWIRARFNAIIPAINGIKIHLHDGLIETDPGDSDSYRITYPYNSVTEFPIWLLAGEDRVKFNNFVLERFFSLCNRLNGINDTRWYRVS